MIFAFLKANCTRDLRTLGVFLGVGWGGVGVRLFVSPQPRLTDETRIICHYIHHVLLNPSPLHTTQRAPLSNSNGTKSCPSKSPKSCCIVLFDEDTVWYGFIRITLLESI